MSLYVCPAAAIAAPCATVWEILTNFPTDFGWLDVEAERVDPPGRLQPGQGLVLSVRAFGRRWHTGMEIDAMNREEGFIDMRVCLPLGIVNHEHMTLAPVSDEACRDFHFPPGWRGRLVERLMASELQRQPRETLRRLKARAERSTGFRTIGSAGVIDHSRVSG